MPSATAKAPPKNAGAKFLRMAETMENQAKDKLRDRDTNTPKRQKEAASARIDGWHLQRAARLVRLVGDLLQSGGKIANLESLGVYDLKTKSDFLAVTRRRIDTSGGYYSIRELDEYSDVSPKAVGIRKWMDEQQTPVERAAAIETARRKSLQEMEDRLRLANIPGFFPTPRDLIEKMLDQICIEPGNLVLEPSAGKGDILDMLREKHPDAALRFVERNLTLAEVCQLKGYLPCEQARSADGDFLALPADAGPFDRIVMNPPFEKAQDIEHVRKAYSLLSQYGRLVSIMSPGPFFREDKQATAFRDWLGDLRLKGDLIEVEDLPEGSFKRAFNATGVATKIVLIEKHG